MRARPVRRDRPFGRTEGFKRMSNIEPNIIDPGKPTAPPGGPPPAIDPDEDELVEPDDIREPDAGNPAVEPDPEEGGPTTPTIRT
jgi:hypothetical protein